MVIDKKTVNQMLDDYFEARGWDRKKGIPSREKIQELGLEAEWVGID